MEDADDEYVLTLLSMAAPNTFFVTTKPGVDGYEVYGRLGNTNSLTRPTKPLPKRIRSLRPSLANSVTSLGVNVIWFLRQRRKVNRKSGSVTTAPACVSETGHHLLMNTGSGTKAAELWCGTISRWQHICEEPRRSRCGCRGQNPFRIAEKLQEDRTLQRSAAASNSPHPAETHSAECFSGRSCTVGPGGCPATAPAQVGENGLAVD